MKYLSTLEGNEELKKSFQKFVVKNKNKGPKLDPQFHANHHRVFREIDCLQCANCCKTTSPIFRDVDIKRIAKNLRLKESDFIKSYLNMDEDKDYVLKSSPCTFLNNDNTCSIYEFRPQACKEYPHTDRKNAVQIGHLHVKNLDICPAVVKILENIIR